MRSHWTCLGGVLFALVTSTAAAEAPKTERVRFGPVSYPVPADWERQDPASRMRTAQFGIPVAEGDEGKCELIVFYFGGGGGSVDENIKRWLEKFTRKESPEKIDRFEAGGSNITTLDVTGDYKDQPAPFDPKFELRENWRMLAAYVETADGPYFFRIVGPKKTVAAQADNWTNMLKGAKSN